ncbi:MAG: histidine kinase dimerization/phosphoacceptor domain -containing protein [Pseudomonadota bacterium]
MAQQIREFTKGLSARIIFLMTLAMLPLAMISIFQTREVVTEAQALTNTALMARTIAAASAERELIQNAVGATRALSVSIAQDQDTCEGLTQSFVETNEPFIFAGFIEADGVMRCSSRGDVVEFGRTEALVAAMNGDGPVITMNENGRVTGQSVVIVSHPVIRDEDPVGIVSLSIPHWVANPLLAPEGSANESLRMASVNANNIVVSASESIDAAPNVLPLNFEDQALMSRVGTIFSGEAGDGSERYYAVTPMIDNELVLVGSWPSGSASVSPGMAGSFVLAFPIAMWIVGIGVAYFGIQRLVVRHIRSLQSGMRRFALGNRDTTPISLDDAPEELLEAERSFNRMAAIIGEAEARQGKDLADKEVLLREVHHRVKNNLQLIASIMNMQARDAKAPETRSMLAALQRRVRGLAMLHRTLYTTPDMLTVDGKDMIEMVVADVAQLADESHVTVSTELETVALYPDQAVPLSMLLAEAMTNAFKHSGHDENGASTVDIGLEAEDDGEIRMTITNSVGPNAHPSEDFASGDGLGKRLVAAFVAQLGGRKEVIQTDKSYTLDVRFPARPATAPD